MSYIIAHALAGATICSKIFQACYQQIASKLPEHPKIAPPHCSTFAL